MMGMMPVPKVIDDILERAHAECIFDPISWKYIIRHKGLTENEKIRICLWYGMNSPCTIEFVEVAE